MKISIITATLPHPERGDLIKETYNSILGQDVEWEWLIQIDQHKELWPNGAPLPDLPRDKRVMIATNDENLKLAKTRNKALERASGDFVMTLDDDDILAPGALLRVSRALGKAGSDADWAGASIQDFTLNMREGRTRPVIPEGISGPNIIADSWEHPWDRFPLIPASSLFRRSVVEDVGGWEHLDQGEDILFLTKVDAQSACLIVHVPFYLYRQHEESFFSSTGAQHWWKYATEDSPEEYRRTREIVFMKALKHLYEPGHSFIPSIRSKQESAIRVELGGESVLSRPFKKDTETEQLFCLEHGRDAAETVLPETRPENLQVLLRDPPICSVCGCYFIEVEA